MTRRPSPPRTDATRPATARPVRARAAKAPAPSPAEGARDGRRSGDDWLAAGQAVLREEGIRAVKLSALTRRLGVSTGSFYHHFGDFEAYLGLLADSYTADRVRRDIAVAMGDDRPGPVERMQRLARQSLRAGTFELDRAMRVWATMDPRAEAAIRRAESLVLDFLAEAFAELGFEPADAALRAQILMAANVAQVLPSSRRSGADFYRGCLELLTQGARPEPTRKAVKPAGPRGSSPPRARRS